MMSWQKQVETLVSRRADLRLSEVLSIAFRRLESRQPHDDFMKHRAHDHGNKQCSCELCEVYRRIDVLRELLHIAEISDNMEGLRPGKLQKQLHEAHNHRRRLLGLPEKKLQLGRPRGKKFSYYLGASTIG